MDVIFLDLIDQFLDSIGHLYKVENLWKWLVSDYLDIVHLKVGE